MLKNLLRFVLYGNYFVALCAVVLCIETSMQLEVSLNNFLFYLFIFAASVSFYTVAYLGEASPATASRRSRWYLKNKKIIKISHTVLTGIMVVTGCYLAYLNFHNLHYLTLPDYFLAAIFPLAGLSYYGISIVPGANLNLRKAGWLKPFVIGFVWAGIVTVYPLLYHQVETGNIYRLSFFSFWFFVKNWMFITVLCIMFDIKDYAADYNHRIKTFVVQVGLRKTIFYIIIPLSLLGFISYIIFVSIHHFPFTRILFNCVPFILLIAVAYSLHRRKPILYYLAVIDGLMLVKAACGILGVLLVN